MPVYTSDSGKESGKMIQDPQKNLHPLLSPVDWSLSSPLHPYKKLIVKIRWQLCEILRAYTDRCTDCYENITLSAEVMINGTTWNSPTPTVDVAAVNYMHTVHSSQFMSVLVVWERWVTWSRIYTWVMLMMLQSHLSWNSRKVSHTSSLSTGNLVCLLWFISSLVD